MGREREGRTHTYIDRAGSIQLGCSTQASNLKASQPHLWLGSVEKRIFSPLAVPFWRCANLPSCASLETHDASRPTSVKNELRALPLMKTSGACGRTCQRAPRYSGIQPVEPLMFSRALTRNFDFSLLSLRRRVAMTSASHAEGRQFDPGWVYLLLVWILANSQGMKIPLGVAPLMGMSRHSGVWR